MSSSTDFSEILKLIVKYLIEGLVVAFVAFVIPKKKLDLEEITTIALMAASTFAILDVFLGSTNAMTNAARSGVGFAVGSGLAGGLPVMRPM